MNLDRNALTKLLALSDDELITVIKEIAVEAGVDQSTLSLTHTDIAKLRAALSFASNEEISAFVNQFLGGGKKQ